MPVYSLTVPAASPFIQYEGVQWSFNNEAIFLNPSSTNTTLSIGVQFVGSEVSITGEPLPHFANLSYSGSLDSQAIQPVQTQFNLRTPMRDLGPGPHDLRLNVLGAQQYVVSNITITAGDADPSTTTQESTIENTSSNITYLRNGIRPVAHPLFQNGSAANLTRSGPANISFYGNDIAVYGALIAGDLVTGYNISLDGQPPAAWPARVNVTADVPSVLLYQTSNLSTGSHFLTISPQASQAQSSLLLDYAVIRTYVSVPDSRPVSSVPVAAIAGGVVGGVAFLVAVVTCAFFFFRRRFRRARLILGGEEGIDGAADPSRAEEDMPPPDYQRIFPRGNTTLLSRAGVSWPRLLNVKNRGGNATRGLRREHVPPNTQDMASTAKENGAMPRPLQDIIIRATDRDPKDASVLRWEGRQPEVIAVLENRAGDSIAGHGDLQGDSDCKV